MSKIDLLITIIIVLAITSAAALTQISTITTALATPCPTEDSENCFWDGGHNGQGSTYVRVFETTYFLD